MESTERKLYQKGYPFFKWFKSLQKVTELSENNIYLQTAIHF